MSSSRSSSTSKITMRNKSQGKTDFSIKSREILKHDKLQKKSDQLRTSFSDNRINNKEDMIWQERIKQVMELTRRSEDDVIMALHDSDGDLNRAVNDLLEGVSSEWEIKKKKARQTGGSKQNFDQSGSIVNSVDWEEKDYLHKDESVLLRGRVNVHGWRCRENKENEKNMEDTKCDMTYGISRRGRAVSGRSGRGGRGAGRGLGPRTFASRKELSRSNNIHSFNRTIDNWNGDEEQSNKSKEIKIDSWIVEGSEDWDNEEYTGSLADTKVFTPSTLSAQVANNSDKNNYEETISITSLQSTNLIIHSTQRCSKQRPRIPPPSKIPSSAVEMPGDTISFLDVQFGALEFGDSNINDVPSQDKYTLSGSNLCASSIEVASFSANSLENSISSVNQDANQPSSSQNFGATTLLNNNQTCMPNEHTLSCQTVFSSRNSGTQSVEIKKQELNAQTSLCNSSFTKSIPYSSAKPPYSPSNTPSNYSAYSCNSQLNQTKFICSTASSSTKSFTNITSTPQTVYNSSYTQSNISTYSEVSPSSSTASGTYNPTATTSQIYQPSSAFTVSSLPSYQPHSVSTNTSSSTSPYVCSGYQGSGSFQSTTQSHQTAIPTFVSSICQGSSVYSNAVQSVYSNSYTTYGCQNETGSQDHKLNDNKELQFENTASSSSSSLSTTTVTLGITVASVTTSPTKTTCSTTVHKSTASCLMTNNSNTVSSISGSANAGNIPPILSHQYIMGQSMPYATFQQPHMYSYEDLQLIQQRMPHMPTTGYYDATVGYQTTGPVTSLGNSRNESLPGVQPVQGVQAVQGQYNSINDGRFTRTDSNASPVSSNISPQSATQHQQPLMNPIPPGYAYFYGGGIMPAGGFQYGTPAIYPQIANAGTTSSTSTGYNTKPGNYASNYASGTSYESLTNSGSSVDYKGNNNAYVSQAGKNGSSNSNANTVGSSTDINTAMYTKNHVALNKVNTYEKQTFHSATPPPFGMTNNQNANVISGYGTAHLFIPTVPHQLHQTLHQDSGSNAGQRVNTSSQSKAQVKPGYNTSYWTGSN